MRNRRNKRKSLKPNNKVVIITCLIIIIALLFFSVIFSLINMANEKIINGVTVENIAISNLNRRRSKREIRRMV